MIKPEMTDIRKLWEKYSSKKMYLPDVMIYSNFELAIQEAIQEAIINAEISDEHR